MPLHIETRRFARPKLPKEHRTCFHCMDNVEDELHFLIDCLFYDDMRRKMFPQSTAMQKRFYFYDSTEKNDISTELYQYAANSVFNSI